MERQEAKRLLRGEMKARLALLQPGALQAAGDAVARHLRPLLEEVARGAPGSAVPFFAGLPGEIDTGPVDALLLELGLTRALPLIVGDDLEFRTIPHGHPLAALPRDRMGIHLPPTATALVDPGDCGIVLVPGLAFDDRGGRLGRGRGFYDRALGAVRREGGRASFVALGLDLQRVSVVPRGPGDVPVDALCTPVEGLTWFRGSGKGSAG